MLRVLLADDHAVVRAGLRLVLEAEPDIEVVGEAEDGNHAVELAIETRPDIVLLDITMPGLGGLESISRIKESAPDSQILILTMHNDEGFLRRALASGAAGYVLKQADDRELLVALYCVARGEIYVPPALTLSLLGDLIPQKQRFEMTSKTSLSVRENEVLRLVAQGYTSKEVAEMLQLAVTSVETYRSRAMKKLGLRGRVQLVRYALKAGWLEVE
ncbi:MAG: response regulator transcription factor [Chloroflexi bacterium]|nr:response regulator transcription factor [Chloroflexota bacterium]